MINTIDTNLLNEIKLESSPKQGSGLAAPITPQGNDLSKSIAATHYAQFGQGGYRTVKTYDDLNNISDYRLELGMMVNVINDGNVNNNGLWILESIDASNNRNWKKLDVNSDELNVGTVTRYDTDEDGVSTVELGQSIINGGFDYSTSTPAGNMIGTKGWYVDAAWVEKEWEPPTKGIKLRYYAKTLSPQTADYAFNANDDNGKLQFTINLKDAYGRSLAIVSTSNFLQAVYGDTKYTDINNEFKPKTKISISSVKTEDDRKEFSKNFPDDCICEEYNIYNILKTVTESTYTLNIPKTKDGKPLLYIYSNFATSFELTTILYHANWYAYLHCANSYPNIFLPGVNGVNYPPELTQVKQYASREDFFNEFVNEQDHININNGLIEEGLIDSLIGNAISYFPRFGSTDAVAEWDETNKCVKWVSGVSIVTDSKGIKLLKSNNVLKSQTQIALKLEKYKEDRDGYTSWTYPTQNNANNILRVSSLANTSYTWNGIPPSQYEVYQYFFSYINGLFDGTRYNIANATKNVPQYFAEVDRGSPNGNCINIIGAPLVGGMDIYTDVYVFGLDANKTAGNSNMTVGKENQTYQSFGLAVGRNNSTIGYANFASGRNNKVGGEYSAAIGDANTTLSSGSYAIGTSNKVGNTKSNKYSSFDIAIGKGLDLTNTDNASSVGGRVAVGRYNKNEPDSIFVVGTGETSTKRKNALNISNNNTELTTNVNVNAFQTNGWNSTYFPTNSTYTPWPSTVSAKGWFLGKIEKIIVSGQTLPDYKIWLTDKQQHSDTIYSWNGKDNIKDNLLVDPKGINPNYILSIYTNRSYSNNFLVTSINNDKSITVKIINTDVDPFSGTFSYSPYFKGVVLITGEDSSGTSNVNYSNYNPINYITTKYITNGIVELGHNNISTGDSNTIGGFMSSAFGPDNITFDGYSTAHGNQNTVMGYSSSAIGQANKIYGEKTIVAGGHNTIVSNMSFVSGNRNTVFNYTKNSTAGYAYGGITVGGNYNEVDLRDQITPASYPSNTVFGYNLQSKTPGQTLFGKFNKVNDSIFAIGNGTASAAANRSNAFEVTKDGLTKANNGLEITKGNLQITDGYLNMRVFKYNDDGSTTATPNYASVKLIAYDDVATENIVEDDLVLNIVDVKSISTLAGNATVGDSIKMAVYRNNGDSTGQTASLQCVQLGEGNDAQYSLRVFL